MPYAVFAGIAAVVAVVAAGYVIRRRVVERALSTYTDAVVSGITRLRASGAGPALRRTSSPDHATFRENAEQFAKMGRELETLGCTTLGELEEDDGTGAWAIAARWFKDGSGTLCGFYSVVGPKHEPVTLLCSELSPSNFLRSQRGGANMKLAEPPAWPFLFHGRTVQLQKVFDAHRARMASLAPAVPLAVTDLTGAEALFNREREQTQRWRAAQEAEALIALDVEAVLGKMDGKYEVVGYPVFARLCEQMARDSGAAGGVAFR